MDGGMNRCAASRLVVVGQTLTVVRHRLRAEDGTADWETGLGSAMETLRVRGRPQRRGIRLRPQHRGIRLDETAARAQTAHPQAHLGNMSFRASGP